MFVIKVYSLTLGEFTKSNNNELSDGSSYFFKVIVTDHGGPSKTTQGDIRIDVFDPDLYVLKITMKMSLDDFLGREEDFLAAIENIIRVRHPHCRCMLWKAKSVTSSGSSNSDTQRRRLLQT